MALKITTEEIQEIDDRLSEELRKLLPSVLDEYVKNGGRKKNVHSFHGVLGLYKPQYIDLVETKFLSPKELISLWLSGLNEELKDDPHRSHILLKEMLKHDDSRKYILIFLERDYYRHLGKRRRNKPGTNFYSIWFGDNTINWGLLIQPRKSFNDDEWINKIPRIEKVPFNYWTIGHVLSVGLVDPENDELLKFNKLEDLLTFIKGILKRLSRSSYEKQIYDLYVDYILNSANPHDEPFLIPEFRYAGLDKDHKYRIDFTILNIHTNEKIGFEISPQSSHMSVKGIKNKTQKVVNEDIAKQWEKEIAKRNDYFEEYGITTITFTDSQLTDINNCFEIMKSYLSKREDEKSSISSLLDEITK